MTWVILGHSYLYFLIIPASNVAVFTGDRSDFHYVVQDFYTIFIQYAFYSVDSFFFLSGLLATFSIWRTIQKFGDKVASKAMIWIPMSYVGRVLRLAPMMMYATAIQWQISGLYFVDFLCSVVCIPRTKPLCTYRSNWLWISCD